MTDTEKLDKEKQALESLQHARMAYIVTGKQPDDRRAALKFFAACVLKLKLEPDWTIPTACTDGRSINYNPAFICSLPHPQRMTVLAHEIFHCVQRHHTRIGGRDPKLWNHACDLCLNPLLVKMGFAAVAKWIHPGQPPYEHMPLGESAEWYYAKLKQEQQGGQQPGEEPEGVGDFKAPANGDPAEVAADDGQWAENAANAHSTARMAGKLPADLVRAIETSNKPRRDPWSILQRFVSKHAKDDYSWNPLNRKWLAQGFYMPSLSSEAIAGLYVWNDVSASIGQSDVATFSSNLKYIGDFYKASMTIGYHDTRVTKVTSWKPGDPPFKFQAPGGGGTDHRPVFEYMDKLPEPPKAVILFTDMDSFFPRRPPAYPVIWASVSPGRTPPFGEYVDV